MSYFFVDLIDCIIRRDVVFVIHALLALGICGGCLWSPIHHNTLRTVSLGAWVELSTPALHRWYATQTKRDYIIYFALFTLCRIIWIPYVLRQVIRQYAAPAMHTMHTVLTVLGTFLYILQLGWYGNMIQTLRRYTHHEFSNNNSTSNNSNKNSMTTEAQIDLIFGSPTKKKNNNNKSMNTITTNTTSDGTEDSDG
jgi:hypothetical protein